MATHSMTLQKVGRGLYKAETLCDAVCVLLDAVPRWLPWVSAGFSIVMYVTLIRLRLFLAKWRRTARRRVEQKYMALGYLHGCTIPPCESFTIVEDGVDGDDDGDGISGDKEVGDDTALTESDIEEFRCSLGIRTPRDDDLLMIVEEMLLVDDIPEGWVLYRTTAGLVRFMHLNTQELYFFHPGRRSEERHIRAELQRRNRATMEARYKMSYIDDESGHCMTTGFNTSFALLKSHKRKDRNGHYDVNNTNNNNNDNASQGGETRLSFSGDDNGNDCGDDDGRDEQSTFRRLFHYFVEREKRRIERDVELKFRQSSVGESSSLETLQAESRGLRLLPANVVRCNSPAKHDLSS